MELAQSTLSISAAGVSIPTEVKATESWIGGEGTIALLAGARLAYGGKFKDSSYQNVSVQVSADSEIEVQPDAKLFVGFAEPQAAENLVETLLEFVSAGGDEFVIDAVILFHEFVEPRRVLWVGHLLGNLVELFFEIEQFGEDAQDLVVQGSARIDFRLLGQVSDLHPARAGDGSRVELQATDNQAE